MFKFYLDQCDTNIHKRIDGDNDWLIAGAFQPTFPEEIIFQLKSVSQIDFEALTKMILPYAS